MGDEAIVQLIMTMFVIVGSGILVMRGIRVKDEFKVLVGLYWVLITILVRLSKMSDG